jgi:predicted esterase
MPLDKEDTELIKRIVGLRADEVVALLNRGFERFEERLEDVEYGLDHRFAAIEDALEGNRRDLAAGVGKILDELQKIRTNG